VKPRHTLLAAWPAIVLLATGCGYHVAGQADLLPKELHTVAIPAFENATTRYKLTQRMAGALTREFVTRTRYRIVPSPADADAVLLGSVINYFAYPTIFDTRKGRATGMQVVVILQVRLVKTAGGAVLYQSNNLAIHNRYEISANQARYFDESDASLDRLSEDVAKKVVSAILENF